MVLIIYLNYDNISVINSVFCWLFSRVVCVCYVICVLIITYFVSSLYETQNEYCQVDQQQLYKKLIMHKNTDLVQIYMDYL
jgi:hypothetical protein